MNVVTRFPPSPTGFLHVGSLRTALYNYLFARKHKGKFLLRVEDTDQTRLVEGAVESLIRTLNTVGLEYDGELVVQSERLEIYKEHVAKLLESKAAYYCFCTKERLTELRDEQRLAKLPTKYDRTCCNLSEDEIKSRLESGEEHVIRMKVPDGETTFTDEIRGNITIKNSEIDDQVLMKADGFPTYHLAVVVDDNSMGVTHVIRGEEWISSAVKHVMLYEMLGFELPMFAHLPLILNPDKSKLSKRQGDVAVEDFLAKGYLPEALLNFVALLGFNPTGDREIYTVKELMDAFELSSVNKSGAVFDQEKLKWMNGQYIKALETDRLVELAKPLLDDSIDNELLKKICEVEKSRLVTVNEIVDRVGDYGEISDYDGKIVIWKKSDLEDAMIQLKNVEELISELDSSKFDTMESIEREVKNYISSNDLSNGNVLWPLRVALSGKEKSPSPFELLWVFGKEESLNRIKHAIDKNS